MMEITNSQMAKVDLRSGSVFRTFLCKSIGEGDDDGNVYGVRCYRDGESVSLSGYSVNGYFIRADGQTVIMSGTVSGNRAYVTLPKSCYAIEGNFTLAIKVIGGGTTVCMRIVDGTVMNTTTDAVIDPGGTVPDIDALMAVIERAEAAAEDIQRFSVYTELRSGTDYTLVVNSET